MTERDFEARLTSLLREDAEHGVRPIDAMVIVRAASATGSRPALGTVGRSANFGRPALGALRLLLVGALFVVVAFGAAFAGGLLPLPGPTPTPSPSPTASGAPSTSPRPTATPPSTPTPSASAGEPTLGAWRELTNFPLGERTLLTAVTAGGPGLVAVGWSLAAPDGLVGRAWVSADGENWTQSPFQFENARLELVAATGGMIYAVGPIPSNDPDYPDVGQYAVWSSPDGLAWQHLASAPFPTAVVQSLVAADGVLVAGGYRDQPGGSVAVVWTSTNGADWTETANPPPTFDVQRLAVGSGVVIAMGNDRGSPPWRSLWYAAAPFTDWQRADAPVLNDTNVTVMDIAAGSSGAIAVGTTDDPTADGAVVLSSADGRTWSAPFAQSPPQTIARVVAVPGWPTFIAFGASAALNIHRDEAGGGWAPVDAPPISINYTTAIGAAPTGVIVGNNDFESGIWFAPFGP
jgi:hypothetical protein